MRATSEPVQTAVEKTWTEEHTTVYVETMSKATLASITDRREHRWMILALTVIVLAFVAALAAFGKEGFVRDILPILTGVLGLGGGYWAGRRSSE
ncbi:MAG: hypothetical protein MH204_02975 [Fimbriimonadaceae bacterium]|nr:hypothetical protein [Fimbriimonadaceae bacterium]